MPSQNLPGTLRTVIETALPRMHHAITEKFPADKTEYDAWYTNRDNVLRTLQKEGAGIARAIRETLGVTWSKPIPQEAVQALRSQGTYPAQCEDGPDGTLSGVAVLLAAWVANQAAAKSRDNKRDCARSLFDQHIRPYIDAAMDLGIQIADTKRKR